jgi:GDP-L-fucose synthase
MFTQNALINTNILDAAHKEGVGRYLLTSSSAVYDGGSNVLDDTIPWRSDPHPSEFGFGWAKRMAELQARAYAEYYGMKIAIVRPSNPYGPRDNFDPERSHVIPALIRRALAREHPFAVWGAGRAVRSFIYAGDVVEAMLLALEHHCVGDPLNVASCERTSIADLTHLILELCGFGAAAVEFDTSKPEGHPGKFPTIGKSQEKIGFTARTGLRAGLTKTIHWYRQSEAVVAHR